MKSTYFDAVDVGVDIATIRLPPHWRKLPILGEIKEEVDNLGEEEDFIYINDFTGEETTEHPFKRYYALRFPNLSNHQIAQPQSELIVISDSSYETKLKEENADKQDPNESEVAPNVDAPQTRSTSDHGASKQTMDPDTDQLYDEEKLTANNDTARSIKSPSYEYHCSWKERDAFGQTSMYGLSLKFNPVDGSCLIKFDGILDGQWSYTSMKGPYGPIEMHDLTVGSTIEVFGRRLTISSANSTAVKWINREAKRLNKIQDEFRRKIESVGQKPCIPAKAESGTVQHITRDNKVSGHINLRKILNENARLGEQISHLGMAQVLINK